MINRRVPGRCIYFEKRWSEAFITNKIGDNIPYVQGIRNGKAGEVPICKLTESGRTDQVKDIPALAQEPPIFTPLGGSNEGPAIHDFLVQAGTECWDSTPAAKNYIITEFCRHVSRSDFTREGSLALEPSATRVDYQCDAGSIRMRCGAQLSPAKLLNILLPPRFKHTEKPTALRRIVYVLFGNKQANLASDLPLSKIEDPNPYHLVALTETAVSHQRIPLTNAMFDYLKTQSRIKVNVPFLGGRQFELTFSLPFYALRCLKEEPPNQKWHDLSYFIKSQSSTKQMLRRKRATVSLCGGNNKVWVAWGLFDSVPTSIEEEDDESDREETEIDDEQILNSDLLISGHHADHRLSDAREYFLNALSYATGTILGNWRWIDCILEDSIRTLLNEEDNLCGHQRAPTEHDSPLSLYQEQLTRVKGLLAMLQTQLCASLRVWDAFQGPNGDINYFVDDTIANICRNILWEVNGHFEELKEIHENLKRLFEECQQLATRIQLFIEQKKIEQENNGHKSSQWSQRLAVVTFSIIAPAALSTAFFAMPETAVPFPATFRTFCILFFILAVGLAGCVKLVSMSESWKAPSLGFSLVWPSIPGRILAFPSLGLSYFEWPQIELSLPTITAFRQPPSLPADNLSVVESQGSTSHGNDHTI